MYFWSLFFLAHSLSAAELPYSGGERRSRLTIASNEVELTEAVCKSNLPQFGLPVFRHRISSSDQNGLRMIPDSLPAHQKNSDR
jgi:hypothetical protein